MTSRQKSRAWYNEPAMYFIIKKKIIRLIKGPDGRWSREDPQPLSPTLATTDFALLERSIFESYISPFDKER